jgi:hypothetical protein
MSYWNNTWNHDLQCVLRVELLLQGVTYGFAFVRSTHTDEYSRKLIRYILSVKKQQQCE